MSKTITRRRQKPKKPYRDFPLFAHDAGVWAKKIRGKLHYFGPWSDAAGALKKYLDQRDDLQAGRTPRIQGDGLTVRELCNRFLTAKQQLVDTGELARRSFQNYHKSCEHIIEAFGRTRLVMDLATDDFDKLRSRLAVTRGPVALGNEIRHVRIVFKYAYDAGLIDRPIRFGPTFKMPSKKVLRQARQANGPRMFEASELRSLLKAADNPLCAMILLGINCGFGQSDIARLPVSAIDLRAGFIDYPRPKTAVERRCPLWPETVKSLRAVLKSRRQAIDPADQELVFITKFGCRWVRSSEKGTQIDSVSLEFGKLLKRLELKRPRLHFYALRHTFETIGGESRDQVAVDHIMGHARSDMASLYRERISDERLRAVVDHVCGWVSGESKSATKS